MAKASKAAKPKASKAAKPKASKAAKPKATNTGKQKNKKLLTGEVVTLDTGNDPFAGLILLKTDGTNHWAEHERKSVSSEPGTLEDAKKAFDEFVNDGVF